MFGFHADEEEAHLVRTIPLTTEAFDKLEAELKPIERFATSFESGTSNLLVETLEGRRMCFTRSLVTPMALNDYQAAMQRTYKPNRKANHALGVAGEVAECDQLLASSSCDGAQYFASHEAMRTAGHISDVVKKDEYHARPADRVAMLKELGDVLWYVSALATDYGFTLEDVATENVAKLKARYPEGFVKGGGVRTADDSTLSCARPPAAVETSEGWKIHKDDQKGQQ